MRRILVALTLLVSSGGCADEAATPPTPAGVDEQAWAPAPVADPELPGEGAIVRPDGPAAVGVEGTWRSTVQGELPDFSFAGYRGGLQALPDLDVIAARRDVVLDFAADPTGESDSTAEVQAAIDLGPGIVWFPQGLYRIDGALRVTTSDTILRGAGADVSRLWFAAPDGVGFRSHLTFAPAAGALVRGGANALTEDAPSGATDLALAAPAAAGDVEVGWVITDEFVRAHGMEGTWQAFNGTWQPFFHRELTVDDAGRASLDVPLRYPTLVRDQASVVPVQGLLSGVAVEDLGVADAIGFAQAWQENQTHVIAFERVKDSWIRGVRSFPSPAAPETAPGPEELPPEIPPGTPELPAEAWGVGAHLRSGGIVVKLSKRVTITDTHLQLAQNRGGGGNGYLFEIRQSSEILTVDSTGRAGRHNFIQNWGFGTTGCVWLRVHSSEGTTVLIPQFPIGAIGASEFHHSLATANLIDSSVFDDGWAALNRGDWSSGAGHAATANVFWNTGGTGTLRSFQYGTGYVIGTAPELTVRADTDPAVLAPFDRGAAAGTEPADHVEGLGRASLLRPRSLYDEQLVSRRRAAQERR